MEFGHQPVMLKEAVEGLNIQEDGTYVDATFGRGGHTKEIIESLGHKGRLIAIDQDLEAIAVAEQQYKNEQRVCLIHGTFSKLRDFVRQAGPDEQVRGVLFDIGVSSPQLDDATRGFSFMRDGPLDMRMDTSSGISAAEWLAKVSERDLTQVLREYGEERFARRIANRVVETRGESPLTTTRELAELIKAAVPKIEKHKHPATRSFQAIRIYINRELEFLSSALEQSLDVLAVGGRLVVITFHSLEDRIVKRFMREQARGKQLPKGIAVLNTEMEMRLKIVGKAVKPSQQEINNNPRARSAVLRIAEKIG
jgi:16S rRNA (cytosine1402-N4)-methyltransferase